MVEDGTTEKDDIPPMPSTRYHQRREKAADAEDQRKGPGASEDSGQEELGSVAMLETANPTEARPTVRSSADVQQAAGKEEGEGAMGQMDNVVRPGAVAVSGIGVELNASSPAAVSERNESVVEVVHATLVEELPPVPIDAEVGYAHAQPARGDPTCSLRSRKVLVCIALAVGAIIGLAFGLGFALIDGDGAGLGDSGSAAADTPPAPIVPSPAPGPTSSPPFPQSQPQSQPQPQPRPTPPAPTAQLATGPQWNPLGADISYDFFFGLSVAISADGFTVAAGAPLGGGRERGQVLVHRLDPATGGWAPLGRPVNGLWPFSELGESADLSADGSVLAVGAPLAGEERGHVRVLDYDAERDEWVQRGSLLEGGGGGRSRRSHGLPQRRRALRRCRISPAQLRAVLGGYRPGAAVRLGGRRVGRGRRRDRGRVLRVVRRAGPEAPTARGWSSALHPQTGEGLSACSSGTTPDERTIAGCVRLGRISWRVGGRMPSEGLSQRIRTGQS